MTDKNTKRVAREAIAMTCDLENGAPFNEAVYVPLIRELLDCFVKDWSDEPIAWYDLPD